MRDELQHVLWAARELPVDTARRHGAAAFTSSFTAVATITTGALVLAYICRRVHCPGGLGVLVDVKLDHCAVNLGDVDDSGHSRVRYYSATEIEVLQ